MNKEKVKKINLSQRDQLSQDLQYHEPHGTLLSEGMDDLWLYACFCYKKTEDFCKQNQI